MKIKLLTDYNELQLILHSNLKLFLKNILMKYVNENIYKIKKPLWSEPGFDRLI